MLMTREELCHLNARLERELTRHEVGTIARANLLASQNYSQGDGAARIAFLIGNGLRTACGGSAYPESFGRIGN
jgi:hypothetical protein